MARARLQGLQQTYQAAPQPGWAAEPQPGQVPGWAMEPQPGPERRPGQPPRRGLRPTPGSGGGNWSPGDDLAGMAMNEAARFIGRAIGRRAQRTYGEQVQPDLAARGEAMLRQQIAIAERHPDVCACLNDGVIFLIGGNRVLPMPNLATLTVDQADALVATLRAG